MAKKTKLGQSLIKGMKEAIQSEASFLPSSNTIGIEELVPKIQYTENSETLRQHNKSLEAANFALNDFNNKLMAQLADKEKQIAHLKELLVSSPGIPIIGSEGLVQATPELQLIELQLQKLHSTAMTRELTLDETKRFDLFIKNKNLINQNPTSIDGKPKTPAKEKSKQELLQTAARKTSEENT